MAYGTLATILEKSMFPFTAFKPVLGADNARQRKLRRESMKRWRTRKTHTVPGGKVSPR